MDILQTPLSYQGKDTCQILVFRSNIARASDVNVVQKALAKMTGIYHVNVDLNDWENILRIECDPTIKIKTIERKVAHLGFVCSELMD